MNEDLPAIRDALRGASDGLLTAIRDVGPREQVRRGVLPEVKALASLAKDLRVVAELLLRLAREEEDNAVAVLREPGASGPPTMEASPTPANLAAVLADVEVDALYAAVVESAADAIFTKRLDGMIMSWNPGAQRLYGYAPEEILGRPVTVLAPPERPDEIPLILARLATGERIEPFETVRVHQDGSRRDVALTISPIRNRNGQVVAASTVARDITARKSAERQVIEELAHSAQHDYLTGLPNRMLLDDRIKQAINAAPRHSGQVAVMFLDLDGFKQINDELGHPLGDQLLQAVAIGLLGCVRASDTVSRQGGDEFVVLLAESKAPAGPSKLAQRMLDSVSAISEVDGHAVEVSASIGIALFPADGHDADSLIKNADIAMYQAKGNGRAGYQFYDDSMPARVADL